MSYWYYPECKIMRANQIPSSDLHFTLYLKSLSKTPKYFPKHPLLKGIPDFVFSHKISGISNKVLKPEQFNALFNDTMIASNTLSSSKLIGQKLSLIIFLDEDTQKIETCAIGKIHQICSYFNNSLSDADNLVWARMIKLESELAVPENMIEEDISKLKI